MIAAYTTDIRRSRSVTTRPAAFYAALVVYIIVVLVAAPQAQQAPAFVPAGATTAPAVREMATGSEIDLMVGRSTILNIGSPIARVSLTVPDVADAMVTSPTQLLIHGKTPGTISLFVWEKGGAILTYEVKVRRDLSALTAQLKQLFPGETVTVMGSGKDVVLSGTVSSQYVIEKAADVAAGYAEKKENVVNLLKQQEGVASNQVMLRVRFAEVSRSAMQELGASVFAANFKNDWSGRVAPPGVPSPDFDADKGLVFSDFLNLFVFNSKEGLGGVVRALSNKGLFQSLAEPNLIATNGKEASFLAGGEYPYPVVQSGAGTNAVTIVFKEFGVRLSFTPTVLGGDLVHLKVKPEVSSLDFANGVVLDGFRVPALSTRRTETEVELRDGQTFAIAGLMNNTLTNTMSKIPGIGDIPIIGKLFQSKAHQKNQTELVVMITPTIIRRGQMGVSEGLPSLVEPYLGAPGKTYPNPDAYVGSPRHPVTQQGGGNDHEATAAAAPAARPASPVVASPKTEKAEAVPQQAPAAPVAASAAPVETPVAASTPAAAVPPPLTKDQQKALDKAREQDRKAAEAEERERVAEAKRQAKLDEQRKADEEKRQAEETKRQAEEQKRVDAEKQRADKLAKEREKREAEIARKNAELAKKKAEEDARRDKTLSEAAARLKQAQADYQAEIEKARPRGSRQ
jgi:pilus assembly protein CpaC